MYSAVRHGYLQAPGAADLGSSRAGGALTLRRRMWAGGGIAGFLVSVLGLVLWSRAGAAPTTSRELASGRQALRHTHCVACHGEGRGDGPSAAGFGTKPSDLTDGRLMNRLAGRVPGQHHPARRPGRGTVAQHAAVRRLSSATPRRATSSSTCGRSPSRRSPTAPPGRLVTVPGAPRQPILFSHLIHARLVPGSSASSATPTPAARSTPGCRRWSAAWAATRSSGRRTIRRSPRSTTIAGAACRSLGPGVQAPGVHPLSPQAAHPRRGGLPDLPRADRPHAGGRCPHRARVWSNDLAILVLRAAPPPLSMGWCVDCHRQQNATRDTGFRSTASPAIIEDLTERKHSIVGLTVHATVNALYCCEERAKIDRHEDNVMHTLRPRSVIVGLVGLLVTRRPGLRPGPDAAGERRAPCAPPDARRPDAEGADALGAGDPSGPGWSRATRSARWPAAPLISSCRMAARSSSPENSRFAVTQARLRRQQSRP